MPYNFQYAYDQEQWTSFSHPATDKSLGKQPLIRVDRLRALQEATNELMKAAKAVVGDSDRLFEMSKTAVKECPEHPRLPQIKDIHDALPRLMDIAQTPIKELDEVANALHVLNERYAVIVGDTHDFHQGAGPYTKEQKAEFIEKARVCNREFFALEIRYEFEREQIAVYDQKVTQLTRKHTQWKLKY